MTHLFRVVSGSKTDRLRAEASTQEDAHLHALIESNPDLLPGEQISPDTPLQWLVIKSEMPVSDPENGQQRWSLDLLLGDQFAWPALVECKLSVNAEIRKEIIGQAVEYAANAQHYWDADLLKGYALDRSAGDMGHLEKQLRTIGWVDSVDQYFDTLVRNLKDGAFRLVFAVDNAPHRLRSTVEFLNREFETIEAILVEIRRYRVGAEQLVTSGVFGYTEEIRRSKRDAAVRRDGGTNDITSFRARIASLQLPGLVTAVDQMIQGIEARGWNIRFGRTGDLLLSIPALDWRVLLGIRPGEKACIEWFPSSHEKERPGIAAVLRALALETGSTSTGALPRSPVSAWTPKVDYILATLDTLKTHEKQ